jgi:hypothetical protein
LEDPTYVDNRSTLSHDFYQILVGKKINDPETSLSYCRKLIEWSIEHACMDTSQKKEVREEFQKRWREFLAWINSVPELKARAPSPRA